MFQKLMMWDPDRGRSWEESTKEKDPSSAASTREQAYILIRGQEEDSEHRMALSCESDPKPGPPTLKMGSYGQQRGWK